MMKLDSQILFSSKINTGQSLKKKSGCLKTIRVETFYNQEKKGPRCLNMFQEDRI